MSLRSSLQEQRRPGRGWGFFRFPSLLFSLPFIVKHRNSIETIYNIAHS